MRIYFVRHAEVIEEYQGRYNGHIDIPLSDKGKADAKELAKKLSYIRFDKAFCSDLLRARQTIEAFDLDCEVVYTDRLREKSWGRHEGMSFDEITKEGLEYRNFEQWIEDLDGEPLQEYAARIWEYFETVLLKEKGENILVVTHAGVIKMLVSLNEKMSLEETFGISLSYGGYLVYEVKERRFILDS